MKQNIHPKYYPNATVICACGNTWHTGSTQEVVRTDTCSQCHPFFTGQQQRILDLGGQVDRFSKRVERSQKLGAETKQRSEARAARERARALVEIVDEEETVEPIDDGREEEQK